MLLAMVCRAESGLRSEKKPPAFAGWGLNPPLEEVEETIGAGATEVDSIALSIRWCG